MLTARVTEGWRLLLCSKGEQYPAHGTESFALFVHVFVASVSEGGHNY